MVLGLTPEGYAVYVIDSAGQTPVVGSINGALLFFNSFNAAKDSVPGLIQVCVDGNGYPPLYVWIEPINRLWKNGVQQ